jgi:hypothetical protein
MRLRVTYTAVLVLVLGVLLSAGAESQTASEGGPLLFTPTSRMGTIKPVEDPTIIRSRNVVVDLRLLRGRENRILIVELFDGQRLKLVRDREETPSKKAFVWYGHVYCHPDSIAVFAVVGEAVVGNIHTTAGRVYELRYLGEGVHSFREIDPRAYPPCALRIEPRVEAPPEMDLDTCSTDPPSDIDVMVVYTADARTGAGGTDAMEAEVYLAVAVTNQTYVNSNITQRLRLAHVAEVTYTESGDAYTDRDALRDDADGSMDNVHTLRNTYAADIVALLVESLNAGGVAYIMKTVSNAHEKKAFAVVKRTAASTNYSFPHELGHIMGARHDWYADDTNNSPYAYNHGYCNKSPTAPATPWRTVMAYSSECQAETPPFYCPRIAHWSNPAVNDAIGGDPTGIGTGSQQSDNAQTLDNTALTVANFRCSSPSADDVWMKDTWSDTGEEPDPLTASEYMSKSPYIWVRNSQDVNLIYQHQHQKPQYGSTNWVYVKLHNGGATTTSGNLELYWANTSTSLIWPTAWTLLKSTPVNSFDAGSTRVVETKWTNLPAKGSYCMIARWNSTADPMTHAETSNINYNVRYNNNIIWRNLEIVDLVSDTSADVMFIVRIAGERERATSLAIRPPWNDVENSFILHGQVIVRFDERLMAAWRRGGGAGEGFDAHGDGFLLTEPAGAVFHNIVLAPDVCGRVRLTFKRLPGTPRRMFVIDAVQMAPGKLAVAAPPAQQRVIGAVSYEIHTDRVQP